jgi:hypothetical protein
MFASHESRTEVVQLPSAGLPADHGLASLGLVMQLTGRTTGALAALAASIALLDARFHHFSPWFWPWFCFAGALCFARSQLHRIAGRDLLRPRGRGRRRGSLRCRAGTRSSGSASDRLGMIAARVFHAAPAPRARRLALAGALQWRGCHRPARCAPGPLGGSRPEGASIVMTVLGAGGCRPARSCGCSARCLRTTCGTAGA